MGLQFDIETANWVAHLLQPDSPLPVLERSREIETLRHFLRKARRRFYSASFSQKYFYSMVDAAESMLDQMVSNDRITASNILVDLRKFLGNRPWTALIIPSWRNDRLDRYLCDQEFLKFIVNISPDDPGIILQLDDPPKRSFTVLDVFSAFSTALSEANSWPGVLLWTIKGDSVFLPFGTDNPGRIKDRAYWIFSNLKSIGYRDLKGLRAQYLKKYSSIQKKFRTNVHFIHLSDLHIGSREADKRILRVLQFIRTLVKELKSTGEIIPIISGDLMQSPNTENANSVRAFVESIIDICQKEPILILGNHDVRVKGFLYESFKDVMRLPLAPRIAWYDSEGIAVACFNTAMGGTIARGLIGTEQLVDIGNELDRRDWKQYALMAAMHHHPIPVDIPAWYYRPFYERVFGATFEKTIELEDSTEVMQFLEDRSACAVLHGHRHIPRAETWDGKIAVVGCGSSVGKVSTTDGSTYMSVNVVTVEGNTRRVSARLLAERVPGAGLTQRHEFILLP
jgi:UDP-2,3-diacylglucosamine pyrophosphatase LpxH